MKRAQGMPGAGRTRKACVQKAKERTQECQVSRTRSGIPCAMAERLLRALPGVSGLLATVATQISACRARRADIANAQLDPSVEGTGPHRLTVRARGASSAQLTRPPQPASQFVTIRPKRPSSR